MKTFLTVAAVLLLAGVWLTPVVAEEPVALGTYRQLFLDNQVIQSKSNVTRHMHTLQRHSSEALLPGPNPPTWEADGMYQVSAPEWFPDEQLYKTWYTSRPTTSSPPAGLAMATSPDGIHWNRPILGARTYEGQETNLIDTGSTDGKWNSGVVYDPDDSDPARRYKSLAWAPPAFGDFWQAYGWYPVYSADGIHWSDAIQSQKVDNHDTAYTIYDELGKQFLMPGKVWEINGNHTDANLPRDWGIRVSDDFQTWTALTSTVNPQQPRTIFQADALDQQMGKLRLAAAFANPNSVHPIVNNPDEYLTDIYNMAIFPYEDMYMAVIAVFDRSGELPYQNQAGLIHLQLACSRNLIDWTRLGDRKAFLALSDKTNFDSGMLFPSSRPLVKDGELWFYYTGSPRAHDKGESQVSEDAQGIGLAKLRRDGFVSLDAEGDQSGSVRTVPVLLGDDRLCVNVDATGGSLRVALEDLAGEVIPGFGFDDAVTITGDHLSAPVRWDGDPLWPTQPLHIVFELTNAKLYSFYTQPVPEPPTLVLLALGLASMAGCWCVRQRRR